MFMLPCHCSSLEKGGQEFKQSRNMEVGADKKAIEYCYLLAFTTCFGRAPRTLRFSAHRLVGLRPDLVEAFSQMRFPPLG